MEEFFNIKIGYDKLYRYYIESDKTLLKLHHSQKEIATGDDFSDFELYLRPSMDFRGKLLERGDRLMVMEPQHLAEEIMAIHQESVKRYKRSEDFMKV